MVKSKIFPTPVSDLPQADIPVDGLKAYLSQGDNHQVIFMEFEKDTEIPEHSHKSQWGIVLDGKIDVTAEGKTTTYKKGDSYFLPDGTKHSVKIYAGYCDITFFDEKERYKQKK